RGTAAAGRTAPVGEPLPEPSRRADGAAGQDGIEDPFTDVNPEGGQVHGAWWPGDDAATSKDEPPGEVALFSASRALDSLGPWPATGAGRGPGGDAPRLP